MENTLTPVEFLTRTKALLPNEAHWTSNVWARDKDDRIAQYWEPAACKFCLMGAMKRVWSDHQENNKIDGVVIYNSLPFGAYEEVLNVLENIAAVKYGTHSLVKVSDDFGFEVVNKLLNEALELAKKAETEVNAGQ